MRIHQFLIFFELFLFASVSLSSVQEECSELFNKSIKKIKFSRCFDISPRPCSICRSALDRTSMIRDACGHGYHANCLQDCFTSGRPVSQHKICDHCLENDHYSIFFSFVLFDAPVLPEGITYIPKLLDDKDRLHFWKKSSKQNNPIALMRALYIGMTTKNIQTSDGYVVFWDIVANRATPEYLNTLLESGVSLSSNSRGHDLATGFKSALNASNFPNAAVFLKFGANINQMYVGPQTVACTLLFMAISKEFIKTVQFLIENGAEVNIGANENGVPLHLAILRDNYAIVDLLLKTKRVHINALNKQKCSPIHSAVNLGKLNALRALIDNITSGPNYYTAEGFGLLQYAIFMGPIESVKFLIERGFPPISEDGTTSYALHLAVNRGKIDTLKFLLEYEADPFEKMIPFVLDFIKTSGGPHASRIVASDPPIVCAILQNNFEAFEALLNAGINPNTRIFESTSSLLHLACSLGRVQITSFLVLMGADIQNLDSNQRPPFSYNTPEFYNEIVKHF